jgi:DNA-binding transcriptional regulator YdaS (Cro superfamily)
LSNINHTWPDQGSNPGRHSGKPATNRLSYGAAFGRRYHRNESQRYCSSRDNEYPSRRCLLVRPTVEDKRSENTRAELRSEKTRAEVRPEENWERIRSEKTRAEVRSNKTRAETRPDENWERIRSEKTRAELRSDKTRAEVRPEENWERIRSEKTRAEVRSDKTRAETRSEANGAVLRAEETSSAKKQKMKRERRRASQVASSGKRYFRVILIIIVNALSNKHLHLIRNPLISCRVTKILDNNFQCKYRGNSKECEK